jgi:hypothetical protein
MFEERHFSWAVGEGPAERARQKMAAFFRASMETFHIDLCQSNFSTASKKPVDLLREQYA